MPVTEVHVVIGITVNKLWSCIWSSWWRKEGQEGLLSVVVTEVSSTIHLTDNNSSLDSNHNFCSGCCKVSYCYLQQSFMALLSPRQSDPPPPQGSNLNLNILFSRKNVGWWDMFMAKLSYCLHKSCIYRRVCFSFTRIKFKLIMIKWNSVKMSLSYHGC